MDLNRKPFEAIKKLGTEGIIQGYNDGTFRPESNVTRGQVAAIVNRVLNYEPQNLNSFKDVLSSYRFAKDIAAMKELGIVVLFLAIYPIRPPKSTFHQLESSSAMTG